MKLPWLSLLTLSLLLCFSSAAVAFKRCPNCGSTRVSYPLSTGLDCGDPNYKIRCDNHGSLWLDTLNGSSSCCWYKTGASVNTYKVYRARGDRCLAYQSFMNLDLVLPVSKWGEPAVEILWEAPREPVCKIPEDCMDLVNSYCSDDSTNLGHKRCFCKRGFRWDSVNAVCEVNTSTATAAEEEDYYTIHYRGVVVS